MPKRVKNIFKEKIKFQKMIEAYERAAKGKKQNKEVILFEMNLANEITKICKEIYEETYQVSQYRKFVIYEPKKREIWSLPFRDRVIHQWYVEEFIKPIFLPEFIEDSYACIEGRGVHKAIRKLQKYMKKIYKEEKEYYILKCDIAKFFYNIRKNILYNIIDKKIKDIDFLKFTQKLLYNNAGQEKGIPIGNYTSQYFANIYLNELDHYIKEELQVKYYVRYMDDFVLLLPKKEICKEYKNKIQRFLKDKLKLELNQKTNYYKNKQGVNFCGYHINRKNIKVLKANKKKIYRKIKKWNKEYKDKELDLKKTSEKLQSWIGHASHSTKKGLIEDVKKKCEWLYQE